MPESGLRAKSVSLAILVPALGRPQRAKPLAANIAKTTTVPHRVVFVCSTDDEPQIRACRATDADVLVTDFPAGHGDFARKIHWAYERTTEPWLFQAADDVRFEDGWDQALLETAERTGALVVGSQDGGNPEVKAGRHSTHTLISRSYCDDPGASMDGPGSVFSFAYDHQWVDTELVQLAIKRGVWAFCDGARVIHEHPFWDGTSRRRLDATYLRGMASAREDHRTFRQRERMWKTLRAA